MSSVDGCPTDVELFCHINFQDQNIRIVWVAAKRKQKLLRVILHSPSSCAVLFHHLWLIMNFIRKCCFQKTWNKNTFLKNKKEKQISHSRSAKYPFIEDCFSWGHLPLASLIEVNLCAIYDSCIQPVSMSLSQKCCRYHT